MVRTRFAPSPTGVMHIGGVRTALYAYLVAKKNNGIFFLRIEDTDRTRFVEGSTEDIIRTLNWLGLKFDGEPIFQSQRLVLYKKHSKKLIDSGKAYEKDGAIWFRVKTEGKTSIIDLVGNREIEFNNSIQNDFVILKSDGYPTYHLAHVVDDHFMETNPVIRGAEWISSIPKHVMLFEAFGWEIPRYAHLPIILGPDRSKLSKRHGAKPASEFRKDGFLPEAILNYMAFLGWNPGGDKEIMSMEEMIRLFELKDVNTSSPVFDVQKLKWMNSIYIKKSQISHLRSALQNFGGQANLKNVDESLLDKLILLAQTRIVTLNDFYELTRFFFEQIEIKLDTKEKIIAKKLLDGFLKINNWKADEILVVMKNVMSKENIRMPVIYKILTGKESGLPLPESLEIAGKEKVIEILKRLAI